VPKTSSVWPLAAGAQQSERMYRIIVLMGIANDAEAQARAVALRQGLRVLAGNARRLLKLS